MMSPIPVLSLPFCYEKVENVNRELLLLFDVCNCSNSSVFQKLIFLPGLPKSLQFMPVMFLIKINVVKDLDKNAKNTRNFPSV